MIQAAPGRRRLAIRSGTKLLMMSERGKPKSGSGNAPGVQVLGQAQSGGRQGGLGHAAALTAAGFMAKGAQELVLPAIVG